MSIQFLWRREVDDKNFHTTYQGTQNKTTMKLSLTSENGTYQKNQFLRVVDDKSPAPYSIPDCLFPFNSVYLINTSLLC